MERIVKLRLRLRKKGRRKLHAIGVSWKILLSCAKPRYFFFEFLSILHSILFLLQASIIYGWFSEININSSNFTYISFWKKKRYRNIMKLQLQEWKGGILYAARKISQLKWMCIFPNTCMNMVKCYVGSLIDKKCVNEILIFFLN